jgi:hypothetical protein
MHPKFTGRAATPRFTPSFLSALALVGALSLAPIHEAKAQHSGHGAHAGHHGHGSHKGHGAAKPAVRRRRRPRSVEHPPVPAPLTPVCPRRTTMASTAAPQRPRRRSSKSRMTA